MALHAIEAAPNASRSQHHRTDVIRNVRVIPRNYLPHLSQTQSTPVAARNLITDVPGILVGHAQDDRLGSGATAIVFEEPAVASIDVRGGGPGTRETDMLDPAATVDRIDAIALSGGSAFGLEAGAGMQA